MLARYPATFLFAVRLIAASVAVTSYALWAFGRAAHAGLGHPATGHIAFQLSILPFVLGVLVVELAIDCGDGSAPEDLALGNRTLQFLGLLCVTLVAVGSMRKNHAGTASGGMPRRVFALAGHRPRLVAARARRGLRAAS